jgi:hypothetical protein
LGRYFPAFHVFSVLLAADPPTPLETKLIRLLTESRLSEAKALVHEQGGTHLTVEIAEEVLIPAIRAIENDLYLDRASIKQNLEFMSRCVSSSRN